MSALFVTYFLSLCIVCMVIFFIVYKQKINTKHALELVSARKQAIKKSTDIQAGFAIESIVPFMESFPYDTRDMQYFGMPIDYICFKGLHDRHQDGVEVRFIEIKKDSSRLNRTQIDIKNAIIEGKIFFDEINISTKPDGAHTIKSYTIGKKRASAQQL